VAKPVQERLSELRREIAMLLEENKHNLGKRTEGAELKQLKRLQKVQAILDELMKMTDRTKL
jgi:hypothetical protein